MIHEACDGDMTCEVKFRCENTETEVLGCGFRNKVEPPPSGVELRYIIREIDFYVLKRGTIFQWNAVQRGTTHDYCMDQSLPHIARKNISSFSRTPTTHYTHHSHHSHCHPLLSLLKLMCEGASRREALTSC